MWSLPTVTTSTDVALLRQLWLLSLYLRSPVPHCMTSDNSKIHEAFLAQDPFLWTPDCSVANSTTIFSSPLPTEDFFFQWS
ncbi:hypothetical protein PFLUV_G00258490 [Perca fluviatilis]|uniref:Uncharacterized protein n=1 Tax=Perca fluviatilis TaxID=8168 RepID=A0A6A5DPH5_PERFL|nr:hypothetical protein PFLUV_G00258490 [Perca fluviatilis]